DVAAAHHQPARGVQRHAADAAPLGDGGRDLAGAVEQEHATIEDVAEIEPVHRVPDGTLDQAVAGCHSFHGPILHARRREGYTGRRLPWLAARRVASS